MTELTPDKLLDRLVGAVRRGEIASILNDLGDHSDVRMDEPFGKLGYFWHAYGDNPSNFSSTGLGTKPGRSLTERMTNAIDAILESRATSISGELPRSPRSAAQKWFGRAVSAPDSGLFNWDYSSAGYDRKIHVVMNESGEEGKPTVDVIDEGIGLTPDELPSTILSLQEGNKISKFYLIGAFGQGGAATLEFCDFVLIVSRSKSNPNRLSFTLIRVLNLDETFKDDSFVYLCTKNDSGDLAVPSIEVDESYELDLYRNDTINDPKIRYGTLVRHICYKLPNVDGVLGPAPGNLYHYLHWTMFDPLLPFRILDYRSKDKKKNELVTGSRNRLMKLLEKGPELAEGKTGNIIRHYRSMEYIVPPGSSEASIGIEYWVVFNYKKTKDKIGLRSHSNELFVHKGYPIIGTLNGQNQGDMSARILRDLGLSMVARHIIIHVDSTNASSKIRRQLFSSNREGFKEGDILTHVRELIATMLSEDEELQKIERELTEKLTQKETSSASNEVKKQVTKLLKEAGLEVKRIGETFTHGGTGEETVGQKKIKKHKKLAPLPTLPFPQVTIFKIAYPEDILEIRIKGSEPILIETDADAEFDKRGLIAVRSEPDLLEMSQKAPLKGGRIRWRMQPKDAAVASDIGKLIFTLTKPDGTQLTEEIEFLVLPEKESKSREKQGYIPPFDIKPINPDDDPALWELVWPDYGEGVTEEVQKKVAYRPVSGGEEVVVYYSTVFQSFKKQIDYLKASSPNLVETFRTQYEIWVAYHAILQDISDKNNTSGFDEDVLDKIEEEERIRVATMQVKQAFGTAQITNELIKSKAINE